MVVYLESRQQMRAEHRRLLSTSDKRIITLRRSSTYLSNAIFFAKVFRGNGYVCILYDLLWGHREGFWGSIITYAGGDCTSFFFHSGQRSCRLRSSITYVWRVNIKRKPSPRATPIILDVSAVLTYSCRPSPAVLGYAWQAQR